MKSAFPSPLFSFFCFFKMSKMSSSDESITSLDQLFHYLVICKGNKLQVNTRLHFPLNLIFQSLNFAVPLSMMLKVLLVLKLQKKFQVHIPIHNDKLSSAC